MKKHYPILFFVVLLITIIVGCKKTVPADSTSTATTLVIGQSYGGGKIFYLDNTLQHGLIVSLSDISNGASWDNTTGVLKSPQAYSTTDGVSNTAKIIATLGAGTNAAGICVAYSGGGYTDWFLPSFSQLITLYNQKTIIGNLTNYKYWSSTEDTGYIGFAYELDFGSGQYNTDLKGYNYLVRAIRAF